MAQSFAISCPLPLTQHKTIVMGHGSGGRLTAQLVHDLFLPAFDNPALRKLDDQAVLEAGRRADRIYDGFLRGDAALFSRRQHRRTRGQRNGERSGDERRHAAVSLGRIHHGRRVGHGGTAAVVDSMGQAAAAAGVSIVTGDTKVVNRKSADKLFVTTAGIGLVPRWS